MEIICEFDACTGCSACANKCPRKCITMKEDNVGFLRPDIDKEKCVDCKLCQKVCPVNQEVERIVPSETYAAWALDDECHKTSMSGGIAAVFSEFIVNNNGVVYGAAWENKLDVKHIRVENKEELCRLKMSKYVQSTIGSTFQSVKSDLLEGKKVLFVGTPCQCAGLINYIRDEKRENLFVVDIICHGVPSQKILKDAVNGAIGNKEFTHVLFRDVKGYKLKIYNNGELLYGGSYKNATFARGFLYGLHSRKSCFQCQYTNDKRCSDITIGDFWGLGKKKSFDHIQKDGISVVLVNTDQGRILLNDCKDSLFLEARDLEEAVEGNSQLQAPHEKHEKYDYFMSNYNSDNYYYLVRKCFWKEVLIGYLKSAVKKLIGRK